MSYHSPTILWVDKSAVKILEQRVRPRRSPQRYYNITAPLKIDRVESRVKMASAHFRRAQILAIPAISPFSLLYQKPFSTGSELKFFFIFKARACS